MGTGMILTEKEAQNKWCPFSKPDFVSDCKASGCAAWRWFEGPLFDGHEGDRRGFCGLAGKPGESAPSAEEGRRG
mgnify:CR=1 FL=1